MEVITVVEITQFGSQRAVEQANSKLNLLLAERKEKNQPHEVVSVSHNLMLDTGAGAYVVSVFAAVK